MMNATGCWPGIGFDARWGFDDEEGDGNWMCIMICY